MLGQLKSKTKQYIQKLNKNLHMYTSSCLNELGKKAILTTVAVTTLSIGAMSVTAANNPLLSTIHHVYVDGKLIGAVEEKEQVQKAIDSKVTETQKKYKDYDLTVGNEISYISEKVFRYSTNDQRVLDRVLDKVEIMANGAVIMVEDEPVVYLYSEEAAEEAVNKLKLDFVSEEELAEIESRKETNEELPPLQENQSRILDVRMNEKVSVNKEKVSLENILTIKEAISLLKKGTLEEKQYEVQEGDVLGSIAQDHNLTTSELLNLNPSIKEDSLLQIGDKLNVTAYKPYVHIIVEEERFRTEEIAYVQKVEDDANRPKGETRVKQEGQNGERTVNSIVTKQNGVVVRTDIIEEVVTKEPVDKIVQRGTKVIPSRGTGSLAWPAVGGYVSSKMGYRWGSYHKGIDIARPSDRTIKAADNGIVESAGWDGGYGNKIVINHQNGMKTVYAHLSSMSVSRGQTVARGQSIGVMGSTGNSTGIHLHFEVYQNGQLKNPLNYLNR